MFHLGYAYQYGYEYDGCKEKGFKWFQKSAEIGNDAGAAFNSLRLRNIVLFQSSDIWAKKAIGKDFQKQITAQLKL